MDNIFRVIEKSFFLKKDLPHLTCSFHLGRFNNDTFDPNVGKDRFNSVLRALRKYTEWEAVVDDIHSSYHLNDKRMDIDENTQNHRTCVIKKVNEFDFVLRNLPLDAKVEMVQEIPIEPLTDEADSMKTVKRTSFVRKNLSIEMMIKSGDSDDMDEEDPETYEMKMTIVDPRIVTDMDTLYNLIYKIKCVLAC